MDRSNETIIKPMLEKVTARVWEQQDKVKRAGKYPNPVHQDNHTLSEWFEHQQQELSDGLVYNECMVQKTKEIKEELEEILRIISSIGQCDTTEDTNKLDEAEYKLKVVARKL